METPLEITPQEVASRLKSDKPPRLLDVREPQEFALCRIDGSALVPMNTVPAELQHLESLADDADLITICHHGVRSLQVVYWLRQQGLENCFSMAGGIDRWSTDIDSSVPRY
jgi:rhodanese-related sulfurtransferase